MTGHGKLKLVDLTTVNEESLSVFKALASEWRLRILQVIGAESRSINQIADALDIPPSTVAMHVKALEEAGLIHTELLPANRGLQKVCSRTQDQIQIMLPPLEPAAQTAVDVAMPIGAYVDFEVAPTCGLASEHSIIGMLDDPVSFLEPGRINAQILFFRQGFVEYRFPYRVPPGAAPNGIQVRMEVCSEAPGHNEHWPSDITLWINGVEVGTWTCPGDFGGTRGALTPAWWLDIDSQFGLLKRWVADGAGTFVDGVQVSDVTHRDLRLGERPAVTVRLGVKPDARHVGGINLFGSKFGNYPQDLLLRITYEQRGDV